MDPKIISLIRTIIPRTLMHQLVGVQDFPEENQVEVMQSVMQSGFGKLLIHDIWCPCCAETARYGQHSCFGGTHDPY